MARSTTTLPGRIAAIIARLTSLGALAPGTRTAPVVGRWPMVVRVRSTQWDPFATRSPGGGLPHSGDAWLCSEAALVVSIPSLRLPGSRLCELPT
jgi:hypothetical protein